MSKPDLVELSRQEFVMSHEELRASSYLQPVTLQQILVLGGYFSIKAITDETQGQPSYARNYLCGITNYEISKLFFEVLAEYLTSCLHDKAQAAVPAKAKTQTKQAPKGKRSKATKAAGKGKSS